jgi:abequosyltransferase
MQDNSPLLSICIPTYNQPNAVRQLLQSLAPQYSYEIEIIIRDDSSDDETFTIVNEFKNKIPIKYIRGKREGLDKAVIFLTEIALGNYVWWIGDDIPFPDAVDKIKNLIIKYENISLIWINSVNIHNTSQLTVSDTTSKFFIDRNDLLSIDLGLFGFITATIFKREIANDGLHGARKHIGSAFACLYIILYVISRGKTYYYLGSPCFSSYPKPPGEVRWYDQIQVFGINLYIIVNEFRKFFDAEKIREAISKNLEMVLRAMVAERAMGLSTGFAKRECGLFTLMRIYWNYKVFYLYFPLLILPNKVLKILFKIYKRVYEIYS